MKFKNKVTGVILETENEFVISQIKVNPDYEEERLKVIEKLEKKEDKKASKKIKE